MPALSNTESSIDGDLVDRLQQQVADLQAAVVSHERIGVATGLLAHQFDCSPEQAWHILVRLSQTTNVKLRTVAQVLTDAHTRRLGPGDAELAGALLELLARPLHLSDRVSEAVHHRAR